MITRIVRMTFFPGKSDEFMSIFKNNHQTIKASQGCIDLKLVRGIEDENTFFTISIWDSESSLDNYRNSGFFKHTWSITRKLFSEKAKAWSTKEVTEDIILS